MSQSCGVSVCALWFGSRAQIHVLHMSERVSGCESLPLPIKTISFSYIFKVRWLQLRYLNFLRCPAVKSFRANKYCWTRNTAGTFYFYSVLWCVHTKREANFFGAPPPKKLASRLGSFFGVYISQLLQICVDVHNRTGKWFLGCLSVLLEWVNTNDLVAKLIKHKNLLCVWCELGVSAMHRAAMLAMLTSC